MTDVGRLAHVMPAHTQLPVAAYFDEALFACELETIFKHSACYVGNEKAVPESGDWRRLAHERGGRVLVRNAGGVELMSNVCRHRQALILGGETGSVAGPGNGTGNLRAAGGNIVCPLHRWTYTDHGELIGAPQFPSTPCKNLQRFPDSKPADDWGLRPDPGYEIPMSADLAHKLKELHLLYALRPGGSREAMDLDDPEGDPQRLRALKLMRKLIAERAKKEQ